MNLKNRKKRSASSKEKSDDPLTTISNIQKEKKQTSPTCYRFNDYDKAEIGLGVANLVLDVNLIGKVTPAKLLRALVRINNLGYVDKNELVKIINSL